VKLIKLFTDSFIKAGASAGAGENLLQAKETPEMS
jgi:hypothetical protein